MKAAFCGLLFLSLCMAWASDDPQLEASKAGQSMADALREAANSDFAFVPAAALKKSDSSFLKDYLLYPTDGVSIVELKGSQVRAALERAISVHPLPNSGFLQVSGLKVEFSKSAPAQKRVLSVVIGEGRIDMDRTYSVAMPTSLANGSLGYFKIWEKSAIKGDLGSKSLETLLAGRKVTDTAPRWTAVN